MQTSKQTVELFLQALNDENFDQARTLVSDDFSFDGVLGQRNSADAYFADMRKMKFKYHVQKIFEDGNDVCVLYDIDMGKTIFTCGWYTLKDGKIARLKVVFDPRPVLEGK